MLRNADQLGRRTKLLADMMVRPKSRVNTVARMLRQLSNHPMELLKSRTLGTPGGEKAVSTLLSSMMLALVSVTCTLSLTELSQT